MGYTELINRLKEKDQKALEKALELIIQNQKDQDEIEKNIREGGDLQ